MLEQVFGSKTRVRLMSLFLHHPEQVFYVRELTRVIDTQINAVRRELENLVEIGLVQEGVSAEDEAGVKRPGLKRKYYAANKAYPLFEEVRALLTKAHVLYEWRIDQRIADLGDVQFLLFAGSFMGLRGQPVDLLVVGDVPREKLRDLVVQAEKDLGTEITYTAMDPNEFRFRLDMSDRFLRSVMEAPKTIRINKLGVDV